MARPGGHDVRPGLVDPGGGDVDTERAQSEGAALAVEQGPEDARRVEAGTHSQSIVPSGARSAPVWQFEGNAYSAMGGKGDGAAALCGCAAGSGLPSAFALLAAFALLRLV
jgi:hypothetical protein